MEGLLEQFETMKTGMLQSRQEILGTLDTVVGELETARDKIRTDKLGMNEENKDAVRLKIVANVNALAKTLDVLKPTQKVVDTNVEYFKHMSKFGKYVGKPLNPAIEDASYQVKFPIDTINRVFTP